jgi:hypothetical protein
MDNKKPERPIQNAADYVDSLLRPQPAEQHFKWKFIEGRRMRDKLVGPVIVPDEPPAQAAG